MRLYHYRSIDSALKELQGTYHLSAPNELNDPLESYVTVFWRGDQPAWEGLFKNYVASLWQALEIYQLAGSRNDIRKGSLVFDIHAWDHVPLGETLSQLEETFLMDRDVIRLAEFLGGHEYKLDRKSVTAILQTLQPKAMYCCISIQKEKMLLPQQEADQALEVLSQSVKHQVLQFPEDQEIEEKTLCTVLSAMADAVSGLVGLMYIHRGLQDEAFLRGADKRGKISENSVAQRKKQGEENGSREAQALQERNWFYAAFDFPQTYVERMQEILYPTAYVTCFSRNNNNSAMWGNYADCHRGICIEYRIDEDNKIPLTDCSYKALEAEPVQYGEGELECNFFTSLGRLTYSQIKTWLTGKHDTSTLMQTYTAEDQYTDKYWEIAKLKTLHKTSEWAYEQEYRISVIDSLDMLREPGRRNVSYDPKVLTGIIFGIKTSEYDKMQILRAVINHGRYGDVTFYQAEYDDQTRKIVIRKRGWAKLLSDHRPQ